MHRRLLAPAVLALLGLALAACDAGSRPGREAAGPELYIAAPRMEQVLASDAVDVVLDLRRYAIGRVEDGGNGQHVHLILDNAPYQAIYDVSKPIRLDPALLTEGTHVLRAFPSAGPKDAGGALHHESRKNPGAFAWVRFHVKSRGGPLADWDGRAPLLTYSRPKGDYKTGSPELARFLVDFYVTNAKLGPGDDSVRATLDGKVVGEWTEWKPWVLATPPATGDHTMVLELLDRDGKPVPGAFNRTERKFRVVP
jgi:hypothetical protein